MIAKGIEHSLFCEGLTRNFPPASGELRERFEVKQGLIDRPALLEN
jgi:hypothetical protein